MLLHNLQAVDNSATLDIRIQNGIIKETGALLHDNNGEHILAFNNAIVFPGLINSHDHLDFNLFPQLGNKLYDSYVAWGNDIHQQNKETINKVLTIPLADRIKWGMYKNLLNGITTVVNHGALLNIDNELITVFQACNVIHSVQFDKNWRWKLNSIAKKYPYTIHVGEGTDNNSCVEIDSLIRWNIFKRTLIGIHGIAMNEAQAKHFKALVWCPASNFFLIGETAQIEKLKHATNILFGTDSTLSAGWNIWEHLRAARKTGYATDSELFQMLTINPVNAWQLKNVGSLTPGYSADLVIARRKESTDYDSFYMSNPEDILMVMHEGNIHLFDSELLVQMDNTQMPLNKFSKINVNGACKYLLGDLPELISRIKHYYPDAQIPVETIN